MKTPLRRWALLSLLFLWMLVPLSTPYSTNAQAQKGPAPLFAGGSTTPPNDGLPQYICAADAFASYYTLQQIQSSGLDVKYKFHLGIVPFLLDGSGGKYDLDETQRAELLASGGWDCLLTTLDSVALNGAGVITTVVDESAGADQIWAKPGITKLNDLKGKRVAYAEKSIGQFMMLYALAVAGLKPNRDVTPVEADSVESAVKAFNAGQADAVSGWEPDILAAAESGGKLLIASDKLRVPIDVVVTSNNAIKNRSDIVQAFHTAWFDALRVQFDKFDEAAAAVVKWGNTDWSLIKTPQDLKDGLSSIAQATLAQNAAIMADPSALILRIEAARRVWAVAQVKAASVKVSTLVEPKYVLAISKDSSLAPTGKPINSTFLMGSRPKIDAGDVSKGQTLAILPCQRFDFLPDSAILTSESRRILEICVLPVMQSTTGTYLKVIGSSAWPGPVGSFTEQEIRDFALARALSVRDYLVTKGVDQSRFIVDAVLPPKDRQNSEDEDTQAQDRFVELTLVESGR
jgi:hypothetical protein